MSGQGSAAAGADLLALLQKNSNRAPVAAPALSIGTQHIEKKLAATARSGAANAVAAAVAAGAPAGPQAVKSNARGRVLAAKSTLLYNVDIHSESEEQPQLEVAPITMYTTELTLQLRHQIAVNNEFICYGLKQGHIRALNKFSASRALLRGHGQPITDIRFFSDTVNILASASADGCIKLWELSEGADGMLSNQVASILLTDASGLLGDIQFSWHPACSSVLAAAAGSHALVLELDELRGQELSCDVNSLPPGIGALPDAGVAKCTSLAFSPVGDLLACSAADGTVYVWQMPPVDDANSKQYAASVPSAQLLMHFTPDTGRQLGTVDWLGPGLLVTGDQVNSTLQLWVIGSALPEASALGNQARCLQTLILESQSGQEDSFFNHMLVHRSSRLVVLANAKRLSVYTLSWTGEGEETRFSYIAEFAVTMPILSLAATLSLNTIANQDCVQLFCIQTQAIQQYTLDPALCRAEEDIAYMMDGQEDLESATQAHEAGGKVAESTEPESKSLEATPTQVSKQAASSFSASEAASSEGMPQAPALLNGGQTSSAPTRLMSPKDLLEQLQAPRPASAASQQANSAEQAAGEDSTRASAGSEVHEASVASPPATSDDSHNLLRLLSRSSQQYRSGSSDHTNDIKAADVPHAASGLGETEQRGSTDEAATGFSSSGAGQEMPGIPGPGLAQPKPTAMAPPPPPPASTGGPTADAPISPPPPLVSTSALAPPASLELLLPFPGARGPSPPPPPSEAPLRAQPPPQPPSQAAAEPPAVAAPQSPPPHQPAPQPAVPQPAPLPTPPAPPQPQPEPAPQAREAVSPAQAAASRVVDEASVAPPTAALEAGAAAQLQASRAPPPEVDHLRLSAQASERVIAHINSSQQQMMRHMLKAMRAEVQGEGQRLQAALQGALQATLAQQHARMLAEREALLRAEQASLESLLTAISKNINRDLPAQLEASLQREFGAFSARLQETVSSSVETALQRVLPAELAAAPIQESLEAALQGQLQGAMLAPLQEGLRSNFRDTLVPAFERACQTMFAQVQEAFEAGVAEHAQALSAASSTQVGVVGALRETLDQASELGRQLAQDLAQGQQQLLQLALTERTVSEGPAGGATAPPSTPKEELSQLLLENRYEEAFNRALSLADVDIVTWLIGQMDPADLLAKEPAPLSQTVLLALLQQLGYDLSQDASIKVTWIREVVMALDPREPQLAQYLRPILEQLYRALQQRALETTGPDSAAARMAAHIVNSVIHQCPQVAP